MRLRSIVNSAVGNILEWYDFGLFAIYSTLFSRLFFPSQEGYVALLETLGIFAAGYICRPIGALIFGYLGDKEGRAKSLRLSILMISLPTLLIGFLPTYAMAGVWAPVLLTLIRIWQGISIGGEYSGNIIYLAETSPAHHRALVASFAATGANLGALLAMGVSAFCNFIFPDSVFNDWGWRVPYLVSGLLCIFVYTFRLQLQETTVFAYMKSKKLLAENPIVTMVEKNRWQVLRTLGLVCMGSSFYYFCFVYLPLFLNHNLHYTLAQIAHLMGFLLMVMVILVPLAGWLCDRVGRRRLMLTCVALIALLVIPGFYWLQQGESLWVGIVMLIFAIVSSLEQGATSITVVENYPIPARYTGLSFGYNIGNGLVGGTVPMLCAWLLEHSVIAVAPAIYIALCALLTGFVVLFFVKETRNQPLT